MERWHGGRCDWSNVLRCEKNSGIVWPEKNLAEFLQEPSDVVPGTSMRLWGSATRSKANLLAYLRMKVRY